MEQDTDVTKPVGSITPLRATAIVGLGSLTTLAMSVIGMKIYALLIGPAGVGLLALMQSVVNVGIIVAGVGVPTSVIASIAQSAGGSQVAKSLPIQRAAAYLGIIGGVAGAAFLILAKDEIATVALGDAARSGEVVILGVALLLSLVAGMQIAILTGHHRIGAVTIVNVGTAVAAVAIGYLLISRLGVSGLAPLIVATAGAQCIFATVMWRRLTPSAEASRGATAPAALRLLRSGIPIAGSQIATTGATFLVPLIVLHVLSADDVGQYRAAAAISIGYMGFFLTALTQDYLPRISAVSDEAVVALLIERRMRLIVGLGAPVIVLLLAIGPLLMHLLYSDRFEPAFNVLQWQLVGDVLRLPAWVLAFVLLARNLGPAYFGLEALSGIALVLGSILGMITFGLPGAGIAYAASQALYFAIVWVVVRRTIPSAPGRLQAVIVALAAISTIALIAPIEPWMRQAFFGILALALAGAAWPLIYRLHARGEL